MEIEISNSQNDLSLNIDEVKRLIKTVIEYEGQTCNEVYVNFIDTKEICKLHDQFFNDPSPTDCISFPIDDESDDYRVLGDVFVCPETAVQYAEEHDSDPIKETYLYVIHGLLHLMGYLDKTESEILKMRAAEKKHLDNFNSLKKLK